MMIVPRMISVWLIKRFFSLLRAVLFVIIFVWLRFVDFFLIILDGSFWSVMSGVVLTTEVVGPSVFVLFVFL